MRKRILFLLAHPDDETFGTGGTIARYAVRGRRCTWRRRPGGRPGWSAIPR